MGGENVAQIILCFHEDKYKLGDVVAFALDLAEKNRKGGSISKRGKLIRVVRNV